MMRPDKMVGAPRFELGTPSPPDWCANRAALRSERRGPSELDPTAWSSTTFAENRSVLRHRARGKLDFSVCTDFPTGWQLRTSARLRQPAGSLVSRCNNSTIAMDRAVLRSTPLGSNTAVPSALTHCETCPRALRFCDV